MFRNKERWKQYHKQYHHDWYQRNKIRQKEYNRLKKQKALLRHGITASSRCVCCSGRFETADHIVADYQSRVLTDATWRLNKTAIGNIQPLCNSCNSSKRENVYCRIHGKYLGMWNHLPNLYNLEDTTINSRKK